MAVRVPQASRPLRGELEVPGDKSIGHRAVMMGAVARGETRIENLSRGADNSSTVAAFRRMGVEFRREDGALCIEGRGWDGLRPSGWFGIGCTPGARRRRPG